MNLEDLKKSIISKKVMVSNVYEDSILIKVTPNISIEISEKAQIIIGDYLNKKSIIVDIDFKPEDIKDISLENLNYFDSLFINDLNNFLKN